MKSVVQVAAVVYFCNVKRLDKIIHALNIIPVGCASALVFSVIVVLTLMPGDDLPGVPVPHIDKLVHFLMFGAMASVALSDIARYKGRFRWPQWIEAALFSVVLGILIEIAQSLMGLGRAAESGDVISDALGAFLLPLPFISVIKVMASDYSLSFRDVRSSRNLPSQIKNLYFSSFPEDERREWKSIEDLTDSRAQYHFTLINSRNKCAGFISWWNLRSGIYVEHFAINPNMRSCGLGALALEKFCNVHAGKPIVLEVELPNANEMACRRIGFYKRCGFVAHPEVEYLQPPYRPGGNTVELLLMTYGHGADVPAMASEIKENVYGAR
jgi:hypothetical protein